MVVEHFQRPHNLNPEDEEVNDDQEEDSEDEPINPLVDALFDEIEDLRLRVCMKSTLLGVDR